MKNKLDMDGVLKVVGIVVAAGGLVSAIFDKDKTKELSEKVEKLEQQINNFGK